VSAASREKAPSAELYAVKAFDRVLSTSIDRLAIDWAADHRKHIVNLSLGTSRPEHADPLRAAVKRAAAAGSLVVAAGENNGVRWLPGSLLES
jgi:subtilisin family serine protease